MSLLSQTGTVSWVSFRSSLGGFTGPALGSLAAIPTLIVAAIALSGAGATVSMTDAQALFYTLTVRVVVVLCVLVISASLFRTEIEADTLTYLTTRSIPRPAIVIGKYAGGMGASALLTVPAGLMPLAVAALAGAPAPMIGVLETTVAVSALACLAYGGIFLLLGLVSRSALVLGLVYGFLWEELILLLPGQFPKLTILYYLLSVGAHQTSSGPLSSFATSVSLSTAYVVPLAVAGAWVVITSLLVRYLETAPQRVSA